MRQLSHDPIIEHEHLSEMAVDEYKERALALEALEPFRKAVKPKEIK